MNRRTLLRTALALPALGLQTKVAAAQPGLTDCNLWLGEHPCRQLPWHGTQAIASNLRAQGVTQAWAGTFDALLHKDLAAANARLAAACQASHGLILPVGAVNLRLPDWQNDVTRCAQDHGMKAIRLIPNYHGYTLDDPLFAELLESATRHKLLVQIVAQMEDERTQHPLLRAAPVNLKPLAAALQRQPQARVMVLNANRAMSMTALQNCRVWLDVAMLEGVGGIESLLKDWPLEKLVFGSHAPFFYWESAKLKLRESELTAVQLAAITHGNAAGLTA